MLFLKVFHLILDIFRRSVLAVRDQNVSGGVIPDADVSFERKIFRIRVPNLQ